MAASIVLKPWRVPWVRKRLWLCALTPTSSAGKKGAGGSSKTKYRQRPVISGSASFCYSRRKAANRWQSFRGFIQGLRVAASSALAARFLAREDVVVLGVLGSGWQARAHAKAMCAVRAIKKILVHSPTKTNRENFVAEIGQELGIPVEAVISGESVANGADILVAATNSVSRVIPPEWLKPGMHVTNVKITELGEETFKKADRLVIHSRKFAPENYIAGYGDEKIECHDPIDLLTEGTKGSNVTPKQPFWLGAPELKDVLSGKAAGRQSAKEITCFNNNIGLGIQFAAIGKAAFDEAKSRGLGREVPTDWFSETVHP